MTLLAALSFFNGERVPAAIQDDGRPRRGVLIDDNLSKPMSASSSKHVAHEVLQ